MFKEENGVSCFFFDFIVTECELDLREIDPFIPVANVSHVPSVG
jgi:hypothetical protein